MPVFPGIIPDSTESIIFSLDSTMARTKQTARKNTGGRKPRHLRLKTKVRTQTDEVKFVKVVTPPKPPPPSSAASVAEPPICIDITGDDEREVAGKVRGMLRDIRDEPSAFSAAHLTGDAARRWKKYGFKSKTKKKPSAKALRRKERKARLAAWRQRTLKTPQVIIEPGVEIEYYSTMNGMFSSKGWERAIVISVEDNLDDPEMLDCRYPLSVAGYWPIGWLHDIRVVKLKDGTEVSDPPLTTPENCTLRPGEIKNTQGAMDALVADTRAQVEAAADEHGFGALVRQ